MLRVLDEGEKTRYRDAENCQVEKEETERSAAAVTRQVGLWQPLQGKLSKQHNNNNNSRAGRDRMDLARGGTAGPGGGGAVGGGGLMSDERPGGGGRLDFSSNGQAAPGAEGERREGEEASRNICKLLCMYSSSTQQQQYDSSLLLFLLCRTRYFYWLYVTAVPRALYHTLLLLLSVKPTNSSTGKTAVQQER